jgi:hypothetical protein
MSFPDDTGMVGFELPSLEEYCGDRNLDPTKESSREDWVDYCHDCIKDIEISKEKPELDVYEFVIPEWAVNFLMNGNDEELTDGDIHDLKAFIAREINAPGLQGGWAFKNEESRYAWNNDIQQMGGLVYDMLFINTLKH